MTPELSTNTKATLLLTAPLLIGARTNNAGAPLRPAEYRRLADWLQQHNMQPGDLLAPNAAQMLSECNCGLDNNRLARLLGRGMLLAQAVEHWRDRAIWVVSRADAQYPTRFIKLLGRNAPSVLYGCGDWRLAETRGLAVVGSRNADTGVMEYARGAGELAAAAGGTVISGGARGVDRAAMNGALQNGGAAVGVLGDNLEKAALNREHREMLLAKRLLLISPYDPQARFFAGNAMQRNKLIYALACAALVVNTDYGKGGTWSGAVEQLEKLQFIPLYIRAGNGVGEGLQALHKKGAREWPQPKTPAALLQVLTNAPAAVGYNPLFNL